LVLQTTNAGVRRPGYEATEFGYEVDAPPLPSCTGMIVMEDWTQDIRDKENSKMENNIL